MKTRITLYAEDGRVLTDGKHFGRIVHLDTNVDATAWHEISEEEYSEIQDRTISEEI
ncbi:MAG: hypothetical protein J6D16_05795 [Clostridia bacterium]|nr:hypothetical protein [Clostridia bacterium]